MQEEDAKSHVEKKAVDSSTITLGDDFRIHVRDTMRATLYQSYLQDAYSALVEQDHLPIRALWPLFEHFGRFLDDQVMQFMQLRLEELKATEEGGSADTEAASIAELIARGEFARIMKKRFVRTVLGNVSDDFVASTRRLFKRLATDRKLLHKAFLSEFDAKSTRLEHIQATGSDLHKGGQQVLILTFRDDDDHSQKVVYKPSPVQADAMLFGNVQRLQKIDTSYRDHFSILEMLNSGLRDDAEEEEEDEDSEESRAALLTYLIVPCCDGDWNNVNSHYGYLEYLTHEPWYDRAVDPNKVVHDILQQNPRQMSGRGLNQLCQREFEVRLANFYRGVMEHEEDDGSDYIAKNREEVSRYSFECGVLLALMTAMGMTDGHCENLFVTHRRRPALLDGETALDQHSRLSPIATNTLGCGQGAMRGNSSMTHEILSLPDVRGLVRVRLYFPERNRLLLRTDTGLETCDPEVDQLTAGYRAAWNIFYKQRAVLVRWFELKQVTNMWLRIVPRETYKLKGDMIKTVYNGRLSKKHFESDIGAVYESNRAMCRATKLGPVVPWFEIYAPQNRAGLMDAFARLNVPVFYRKADGVRLYAIGSALQKSAQQRQVYIVDSDDEDSDEAAAPPFFNRSPLESISRTLTERLSVNNFEKLEETLEVDSIRAALGAEPEIAVLPRVLEVVEQTHERRSSGDDYQEGPDETDSGCPKCVVQ